MICAHCYASFSQYEHSVTVSRDPEEAGSQILGSDTEGLWWLNWPKCPECKRFNVTLVCKVKYLQGSGFWDKINELVHPRLFSRESVISMVPEELSAVYSEAVRAPARSKAAMCGRLLQIILRDYTKVKPGKLVNEIKEAVNLNVFPRALNKSLDAVRQIRNLAVHPIEDVTTGALIEVDELEARWLLEIIEELFRYYFLEDPDLEGKLTRLNEKLVAAGKLPLRTS